jgi:hypothetical protein
MPYALKYIDIAVFTSEKNSNSDSHASASQVAHNRSLFV